MISWVAAEIEAEFEKIKTVVRDRQQNLDF
jgi:hypothetical protein